MAVNNPGQQTESANVPSANDIADALGYGRGIFGAPGDVTTGLGGQGGGTFGNRKLATPLKLLSGGEVTHTSGVPVNAIVYKGYLINGNESASAIQAAKSKIDTLSSDGGGKLNIPKDAPEEFSHEFKRYKEDGGEGSYQTWVKNHQGARYKDYKEKFGDKSVSFEKFLELGYDRTADWKPPAGTNGDDDTGGVDPTNREFGGQYDLYKSTRQPGDTTVSYDEFIGYGYHKGPGGTPGPTAASGPAPQAGPGGAPTGNILAAQAAVDPKVSKEKWLAFVARGSTITYDDFVRYGYDVDAKQTFASGINKKRRSTIRTSGSGVFGPAVTTSPVLT